MPADLANQVVVVEDITPRTLAVHSWPLRDEPLASSVLLVIALAVGFGVGFAGQSVLAGIASSMALILALRNLWLPAEYQLDALGVRRTMLGRSRQTPWREIGGYQIGSSAIVLSPDQYF